MTENRKRKNRRTLIERRRTMNTGSRRTKNSWTGEKEDRERENR